MNQKRWEDFTFHFQGICQTISLFHIYHDTVKSFSKIFIFCLILNHTQTVNDGYARCQNTVKLFTKNSNILFLDRISNRNIPTGVVNVKCFTKFQNDAAFTLEFTHCCLFTDSFHRSFFLFAIFICNEVFILCQFILPLSRILKTTAPKRRTIPVIHLPRRFS